MPKKFFAQKIKNPDHVESMFVLHGGFLDNRHVVDAMEPLFEHRSGWKRIYIDLPGHGKSTVNTSVTSHDQVLDIILNFVKVIAPEPESGSDLRNKMILL